MDNNTTLDQRSLPWTIKSSMDDLQMSMDDQTVLRQTDEYATLGKLSTFYSGYKIRNYRHESLK